MRNMASLYNPYTKFFDVERLYQHLHDWWNLVYEKEDDKNKMKTQNKYSNALKVAIASLCEV